MKNCKFSLEQAKSLIKQMVVLVDTREKQNRHILDYFAKNRIAYLRTSLEYGDYSFMIPAQAAGADLYFHRDIVIERKASLEELSGNLSRNRERFEKEFLKASNDAAKVYLMVEAPGGYSSIIQHEYKTDFAPAAFMASMKTWESRFGCNVQFINPLYSGYYIASTFQYFAREALK